MSKVNALFHIVINTKERKMTIPMENREVLYKYITGIVQNKGSRLITAGGISNHVHVFVDLNPTTALSDLVKSIKQSTSMWMKDNPLFPQFEAWGREYFAFSVSNNASSRVKEYIARQEEHHTHKTYEDELKRSMDAIGEIWGDYLLT